MTGAKGFTTKSSKVLNTVPANASDPNADVWSRSNLSAVVDYFSGQTKTLKVRGLSTGIIGECTLAPNGSNPAAINVYYDGAVFTDTEAGESTILPAKTFTGFVLPNIGTQPFTYIGVNKLGVLQTQGTDFTNAQKRDIAKIGVATHTNLTSISSTTLKVIRSDDVGGLVNDVFEALGPINVTGNTIEPASTDLSIKITAGKIVGTGVNSSNTRSPNTLFTAEQSPKSFVTSYRAAGPTGTVLTFGQTQVDVSHWDNGSGPLATVSGNSATVKPVYFFPDSLTVSFIYGQTLYSNIANALSGYLSESFEIRDDVSSGILLGWFISKGSVTNLTAAFSNGDATFRINQGFGSGGSGGGLSADVNETIPGLWDFINGLTINSSKYGQNAEIPVIGTVPAKYEHNFDNSASTGTISVKNVLFKRLESISALQLIKSWGVTLADWAIGNSLTISSDYVVDPSNGTSAGLLTTITKTGASTRDVKKELSVSNGASSGAIVTEIAGGVAKSSVSGLAGMTSIDGRADIVQVTASRNLAVTDSGKILVCTGVSPITLTVPVGLQTQAFNCIVKNRTDTDLVSIVGDGTSTVVNPLFSGETDVVNGGDAAITPTLITNAYEVDGALQ